jgi:thiosulfate/3-mercaptopyruvate sulfurtransferase
MLTAASYGILLLSTLAALEQKPERYPRPELLIEAAELAQPETAKHFRILDVRASQQYRAGHISGALLVETASWNRDFLNQPEGKSWQERIGRLGIDANTPVVVYGDDLRDAARIWWMLRYWGVKDVRLLNGGWEAWLAARGPVQKGDALPTSFATVPGANLAAQAERLSTKEHVLEALKQKQIQIVDARSTREFRGEVKMAKRGGSIPTAVHLEWSALVDPQSQRFKTAAELTKVLQDRGLDVNRPTVTYCQSGARSAVMAFALELMGGKDVRNYYRSWAEWGNADDTPIVKPEK